MGGTGWHYVVPYTGDITSTLAALHQRVFEEKFARDWADLTELWADEEVISELGTHTVLDVFRIVETTEAPSWRSGVDYQTLRPLAADRIRHHLGTDRPTVAQYGAARDALDAEHSMRWTGLYVLLYDGDRPTHVAIWGSSGG